MDHHNSNIGFLDPAAEDADEALSLSELPLNEDDEEDGQGLDMSRNTRRSSSQSTEFFEFLSDVSSDSFMCSAEDIFYRGKLIPFKEQHSDLELSSPSHQYYTCKTLSKDNHKKQITAFRRRSESLSELESSVTRSNSARTKLMRNSRSLDYRKLQRPSNSMVSPYPEMERNSSVKSVGKSDKKAMKPARWCFLLFGIAKVPAEMELSDIKSRQFRRTPSTLFPPVDAEGNPSANRGSGKVSWRLLKALSCKDHTSVAVTASLCAPQAWPKLQSIAYFFRVDESTLTLRVGFDWFFCTTNQDVWGIGLLISEGLMVINYIYIYIYIPAYCYYYYYYNKKE